MIRILITCALAALALSAPALAQTVPPAYADWYRTTGWGSTPPAPDGATALAFELAKPYVDRGVVAKVKVPSARAQALADAMVDFRQPGLPGLTFGEYWLAALIDAAGVDPDAEWLAAMNARVLARDWTGALALVKARGSNSSPDFTYDDGWRGGYANAKARALKALEGL